MVYPALFCQDEETPIFLAVYGVCKKYKLADVLSYKLAKNAEIACTNPSQACQNFTVYQKVKQCLSIQRHIIATAVYDQKIENVKVLMDEKSFEKAAKIAENLEREAAEAAAVIFQQTAFAWAEGCFVLSCGFGAAALILWLAAPLLAPLAIGLFAVSVFCLLSALASLAFQSSANVPVNPAAAKASFQG